MSFLPSSVTEIASRGKEDLSADQLVIHAFSYEVGAVVRKYEERLTPAGVSAILFDLAMAKLRQVRGREYQGEKVN